MPSGSFTISIPVHAPESCPRCATARVRVLVSRSEGDFTWRDCESCGYLWATPHRWSNRDARHLALAE